MGKPTLKNAVDNTNKLINMLTLFEITLNSKSINMDILPIEVIRNIYEYDSTYNIKFDKVLKQLSAHCFIYNCHRCFKPWNSCYCFCVVCKTYLKFCHQIYYDQDSTYEDELEKIMALSG